MNTDTAKFIAHIKNRPVLWDRHYPEASNRDLRRLHFQQLAEELGLSVGDCQKKLKHLKDHMRKCISKLPKTESGQPVFSDMSESGITWPYYRSLIFMKDQFCQPAHSYVQAYDIKYSSDNAESAGLVLEVDEEEEGVGHSTDNPDGISMISAESTDTCSPVKTENQRKRKAAEVVDEIHDSEYKKQTVLFQESQTKDEWTDFTKDIANDFRKIKDPFLKLEVKSAVRRAVEQTLLRQLQLDKGRWAHQSADSNQHG